MTPITEAAQIGEPLTQEEIVDIADSFAEAALEAQRLGCDGVNMHGAHGYIIDQFFWSRTNRRDDHYGGDPQRRTCFATELIRAVRERVGPDFPIFFRWSESAAC